MTHEYDPAGERAVDEMSRIALALHKCVRVAQGTSRSPTLQLETAYRQAQRTSQAVVAEMRMG
eukprot:scaffold1487_cov116-Isochrysis_galbana.AAC.6